MVTTINSPSFNALLQTLAYHFEMGAKKVHTMRWQGVSVKNKPDMATRELLNIVMGVSLPDVEDLDHYRADIRPNLPWADDHFEERVQGIPYNPGQTWRSWPYSLHADKFRTAGGDDPKFNHTYMERYWPKHAGDYEASGGLDANMTPRRGIRHTFGDLADLIVLLADEPDTRQAYLPIFFPEDTGKGDGGRKPCTLGYQFIVRDGRLHVYYPMRSCDFVRHLQDDIYLTVRLLLWVLSQCRLLNPTPWRSITPGTYTMHCTSLHMFENDWNKFIKERTS